MRIFRKVVLPIVWALIFGTMAVSLAVIAFGSDPKPEGSGLTPTGDIPAGNTSVSRGTVENILNIAGTIVIDPAVAAKAANAGVLNHIFVPAGAKVGVGEPLYQIRSDGIEENGDPGDEPKAKPKPRYVNVLAARAGKVGAYAKELNDSVTKGEVVTSIQLATFRAVGTVSPLDQYRLLDKPKSAQVSITGGPAPFTCGDLRIGEAMGASQGQASSEDGGGELSAPAEEQSGAAAGDGEGISISCKVPEKVTVFHGLKLRMVIDAGRAEDTLVVPVTAVRGLVGSGVIWVVEDGKATERSVSLGVSDGKVVEITEGADEGEKILEFVPGSKGQNQDRPDAEEMM